MNGIRMHRVLLPRGHFTATIPVTFVTAETWREQRERLDGRARAFADAAGFEPKPGRHLLLPAAEGAHAGAPVARAEEIIELDVECDDEGVESGGQRGLQGRRCLDTANFGALNPFQLFRINHLVRE